MEPIETPPSEAPRSRSRLNSTIVATGAAVALTIAGLGIAGAQTGSSTTTPDPAPAAGAQAEKPADAEGRHGPGKRHHHGRRQGLAVAAKAIGISEADLRTALRSGQSIADVAKSKNVDVQKVIDALVAEAKKNLAEKVAAGEITQAQADRRSAGLTGRITALVNHAGRGPGGEQRRGFRGPGPGGDAPASAPMATNA